MDNRRTLRPVTLRRVIEICSLTVKTKEIDFDIVARELLVGSSRAREIILEVEKMGLLKRLNGAYTMNDKAVEFLQSFENSRWDKMHECFLMNYQHYRDFIKLLESLVNDEKGLLLNEIVKQSINQKLNLNQTAVEVLSDWCERLGIIQRHLYDGRIYLIKNRVVDLRFFKKILVKCYRELSLVKKRRRIFVEIPVIRENICEQLKITRKIFDKMMNNAYLENIGKIELSGAPITTIAKKSPLSEKIMKYDRKQLIMSPKFEAMRKREGMEIRNKSYYYMAMHQEI